jgi:aryl-alcohol dehydrogenase-like predicted oxidoreductase
MTMVDLTELSRIGFGCYRVSAGSRPHREALQYALREGCNLIDTAATYTDGASECLVGEVLAGDPGTDVFVVTKAGYIQGRALQVIEQLNERGLARSDLVRLADDFSYSIHPDFLCCQLEISLGRLQRGWVDGFLLHNPERSFAQAGGLSPDEYYERIRAAFQFLEEMVAEGKVRYYGVSSNTLASPPDDADATDVRRLVAVAETVTSRNHFRLIQFPFNLLETAGVEKHQDGLSLIDLAKRHGLRTFGNRPLNATSPGGFVRLASYEDDVATSNETGDAALLTECLGLIRRQMSALGLPGDPTELGVVKHLCDHWTNLGSAEAVAQVFEDYFFPFLDKLYEGLIPESDRAAYAALYGRADRRARKQLAEKARQVRNRLVRENRIGPGDARPLEYIACESYLSSGIDHVLVGMKDVKYVEGLKGLFRVNSPGTQEIGGSSFYSDGNAN